MAEFLVRGRALAVLLLVAALMVGCESDDDATMTPAATGTVVIDPAPDDLLIPWVLIGPADLRVEGTGDRTIDGLNPGEYYVAWGDVDGWVTPLTAPQDLVGHASETFTGAYTEEVPPMSVIVDVTPNSIAASWTLHLPDGSSESGVGDRMFLDMSAGDYEIEWGSQAGYATPASEEQTLIEAGALRFDGRYVVAIGPTGNFVDVPNPGLPHSFTMGSDVGADETPHSVTLTRAFRLFDVEFTNGQLVALLQWALENGHVTVSGTQVFDNVSGGVQRVLDLGVGEISYSNPNFRTSQPNLPTVELSWYGAAATCDLMNLRDGLPLTYDHGDWSYLAGSPYDAQGYRLPTEAEWEYACRAATETPFATGECLGEGQANFDATRPYEGCPAGAQSVQMQVGGSYAPNSFGLYDMHGNAREWCADFYAEQSGDAVTDPVGPATAEKRVTRGGYWGSPAVDCRSAARAPFYPAFVNRTAGLRPAQTIHAGGPVAR